MDDALGASANYIIYPRTNEDFILNLQKTNPLDYTFYGICATSCPGPLAVVCNYDVAGVTGATQADLLKCMTTPSAASAGSATDCGKARSNCWINAQPTASIMFHCIPQYNVSNAKTTRCTYPAGVVSADDPSCILATDTQFGSVQRPAKPNLLFDQLNTVQQIWGRWFGDLARAWWVILLVSVGLALLLGFVYVQLLKYLTGKYMRACAPRHLRCCCCCCCCCCCSRHSPASIRALARAPACAHAHPLAHRPAPARPPATQAAWCGRRCF